MFKTHRTFQLTTGVKNNTIAVICEPRTTKVIYHNTIVFEHTRTPNKTTGVITIRTNGWDTVSTRIVINNCLSQTGLDWQIIRKKGVSLLQDSNGLTLPLVSGMELHI